MWTSLPLDRKIRPRIRTPRFLNHIKQGKESFLQRFEQEWRKLECAMDALGALRPQLPELASASGERMR